MTYASRLAVALSWVLIRRGDAVGLVAHNESVTNYIPPQCTRSFWECAFIGGVEPSGPTDLAKVMLYLASLRVKRCHFVILSDCLDFRTKFTSIARQLKRRRHQVRFAYSRCGRG